MKKGRNVSVRNSRNDRTDKLGIKRTRTDGGSVKTVNDSARKNRQMRYSDESRKASTSA
ncbi:MAG: hypothetical protein HFE48_05890 [Clostridia bacterium]|nr:hypothetical protein [Clostridia bacterium]